MSAYKSFETERLLLKPMSNNDSPFLLELLNSPKWIKYIRDRNVYTIIEAATYVKFNMTPQLKIFGLKFIKIINYPDDDEDLLLYRLNC